MILVFLHTVLVRILLIFLMFLYFIPFLLMHCVPTSWLYTSRIFYCMTYSFYWLILKCSLLSFRFVGTQNLPQEPAIIVANHQSLLDIPIIGVLLGTARQTWLASDTLKESFIFRVALPKFVVWVDMSTSMAGVKSLVQVIKLTKKTKQHIVIFPEGGRYADGTVHNFFAGFAILARKMDRPVIPIKIFDLYKVYPPHAFWIHWYPIKVLIGEPFVLGENESNEHFRDRVYQWFLEQK